MNGSQTHFVEPKKLDTKTHTVIFYVHRVHEQLHYSLVTNQTSGCYGGKIDWKGCKETFWVTEMSYILR